MRAGYWSAGRDMVQNHLLLQQIGIALLIKTDSQNFLQNGDLEGYNFLGGWGSAYGQGRLLMSFFRFRRSVNWFPKLWSQTSAK